MASFLLYSAIDELKIDVYKRQVLYFTGLAHSLVGAVVPSILAVATLAGMAVQLKKRNYLNLFNAIINII